MNYKNSFKTLAVLTFLASVFPINAEAYEALKNRRFESGTDLYWSGRTTQWVIRHDPSNAFQGEYYLAAHDANRTHQPPSVFQDMKGIRAGERITFRAKVKSRDNIGRTIDIVIWELAPGENVGRADVMRLPINTEWQEFAVSYIKQRPNTVLRTEIYWNDHDPTELMIDDTQLNVSVDYPITNNQFTELGDHRRMKSDAKLSNTNILELNTRTWTKKLWQGFTGGVAVKFLDHDGNFIGMSQVYDYGVDGVNIIPSEVGWERDDSEQFSVPSELLARTYNLEIEHTTNRGDLQAKLEGALKKYCESEGNIVEQLDIDGSFCREN